MLQYLSLPRPQKRHLNSNASHSVPSQWRKKRKTSSSYIAVHCPYELRSRTLQWKLPHQSRSLEELPLEMMSSVFEFLSFPEVAKSLTRVSKTFNKAAQSRQYRRSVSRLAIQPRSLSFPHLCKLIQSLGKLRGLELCGHVDLSDSEFMYLTTKFSPRLETLTIEWATVLSDVSLVAVAKACPSLAVLSIFKGRHEAERKETRHITDHSLQALARYCCHLQSVSLAYTQLTKHGRIISFDIIIV